MATINSAMLLQQWQQAGWINALDVALVDFLQQHNGQELPLLLQLAVVMLSQQLSQGHVCLDIERSLQKADQLLAIPDYPVAGDLIKPSQLLQGVNASAWLSALDNPLLLGSGQGNTPLVLQQTRLYLRRYWQYEYRICLRIQQLMQSPNVLDNQAMQQSLAQFFSDKNDDIDWQKIACAMAARSRFSIITGGPGTGKTTTVVKLLLLLQQMQQQNGQAFLNIRLAAPTGKAAARLKESVINACQRLLGELSVDAAVAAHIPQQVVTLHRLLGKHGATRRSRYHQGQPLPLDVLIIDEASMVDIEMLAQVLDALPSHATLILLGDKDQLASVEAGAILGELCRNTQAGSGQFNNDSVQWLQQVSGEVLPAVWINPQGSALDQHIVMLQKSHRFRGDSGIGQLAQAVNQGDFPAFEHIWQQNYADISRLFCRTFQDAQLQICLIGTADGKKGFAHYLSYVNDKKPACNDKAEWDNWAKAVLNAFAEFQILCATREGEWGVNALNQSVSALLQQRGLLASTEGWFEGRPVLVTRNDYQTGLMNGDIGITLNKPVQLANGDYELQKRVAFFNSDGSIKWLLPSRLNHVETVFAMTVHKSQGSEFSHVLLVLPEFDMPILSRELIYTGITRAKHYLSLLAPQPALLPQALVRRVERSGGIKWQMQG